MQEVGYVVCLKKKGRDGLEVEVEACDGRRDVADL